VTGVVRVKICGITSVQDALLCVEAGADALGFIFVEGTPRYLAPAAAAPIILDLPPFVTPVGVFWDHAPGHIKAVAETTGVRVLQLHGDEPPEIAAQLGLPVLKTIKVGGRDDLARLGPWRGQVAAFLLDSPTRWSEGQPRAPIAWELARIPEERIVLAAGLGPDNVARAIAVARPYAVDVNSGVEAVPGRKDPDKVRRFVEAVREAG